MKMKNVDDVKNVMMDEMLLWSGTRITNDESVSIRTFLKFDSVRYTSHDYTTTRLLLKSLVHHSERLEILLDATHFSNSTTNPITKQLAAAN